MGTSVRLSGEARFVIHGRTADLALVPARGDAGPLLVLVQGLALGAADRRNILATDQTRPVGLIRFDASEVPADAVLQEGAAAEAAVARLRGMRAVALANESVGGADRALEMATAYALQREQFGRIIGSFQAIKHKLANMLVLVEHARTAARYAAASPVDEERDLLFRAAVAKAYCGDACVSVAADTIQVHGGIGFTWEHAAHLYYKRACLNAELVWSTLSCREFIRRSLFG
ncbi:MAG: acyl-CoA dehydrogenase family protein [Actinomycetota bacterium]